MSKTKKNNSITRQSGSDKNKRIPSVKKSRSRAASVQTVRVRHTASGQRISGILAAGGQDLASMSRAELAETVSKLASAANKRISRMEAKGISTDTDRFSVKGKDVGELMTEYIRAKSFLESPTGSINKTEVSTGSAALRKEVREYEKKHPAEAFEHDEEANQGIFSQEANGINKKGYGSSEFDYVWRVFDRLHAKDPTVNDKKFKYSVVNQIASYYSKGRRSISGAVRSMNKWLTEQYEANQRESVTNDKGVSSMFH